MNKTILSLLAVWLILPFPATATHLAPDEPHPELPDVPEEPVVETEIIPADHAQEEAAKRANGSVQAVNPLVDLARERANAARDAVPAPGILRIMQDDLDGNFSGVFNDWQVIGDPAWDLAMADSRVYTPGTGADGHYPSRTRSLLVTPEIDLRTGFVDPITQQGPAGAATGDALTTSAIYRLALKNVHFGLNAECYVRLVGALPACVVAPLDLLGIKTEPEPREGLYQLGFDRRHNLARTSIDGFDGVQVAVFTKEPTAADMGACRYFRDQVDLSNGTDGSTTEPDDPVCTLMEPLERTNAMTDKWGVPTKAFGGERAYSGFSDWNHEHIDLTRWAERSVWVGFVFASGNTNLPRYFDGTYFDQSAGFHGFQVDNLDVTVPAPAHNLRIRPIDEPSLRPEGHKERPTLPLGEDIHFQADVANRATKPVEADLELRVVWTSNETVARSVDLETVHLEPAQTHRVSLMLPDLAASQTQYRLELEATQTRGPERTEDADPSDNLQTVVIDIMDVPHIEALSLERSAASIDRGEDLSFRLTLENRGNVPSTSMLHADLVNAVTRSVIAGAPFDGTPADLEVEVPAASQKIVWWNVSLQDPGQYHLFVRLNDEAPFSENDLVPRGIPPIKASWVDGGLTPPPTIDGAIEEGEWSEEAKRQVEWRNVYQGEAAKLTDQVRTDLLEDDLFVSNSATHVFIGLELVDYIEDPDDGMLLFLDAGREAPIPLQDNLTWSVATGEEAGRMAVELSIPRDAIAGLEATSVLRFMAVTQDYTEDDGDWLLKTPYQLLGAPWQDGEGLRAPDGSLRDEMDSWLPIRLALPPEADPGGTARMLSLGVGVERSPPPFVNLALDECTGLDGWMQTLVRTPDLATFGTNPAYDETAVKWNCGAYGPDGKQRLYEGYSPTSMCGGEACPPWSQTDGVRQPNSLVSAPIQIADVVDPYLTLRHQYSTEVYIADEGVCCIGTHFIRNPDYGDGERLRKDHVTIPSVATVHVQELDPETGTWDPAVLLRPVDGYSTEESVGIQDLSGSPRGGVNRFGTNDVEENPRDDGWWWPTGHHPHYRPPGADLVEGADFSGSPWLVDRIPLFGSGHGEDKAQTVFFGGKTVRFLFSFTSTPGSPDADAEAPRDFGWRIEGITIGEGAQFSQDLAVTNVSVDAPLYDPVDLGIGPGGTVDINVTVHNAGTQAIDSFVACVRALDITAPATGGAPPCGGTSDIDHFEADSEAPLPPGQTATLTVAVPTPADEGALLSFAAAVQIREGFQRRSGDDFPGNDELRNPQPYEVKASPDLGVATGTDKLVGSPDETRGLLVVVENRGNVPLSDFSIRRTVTQEGTGSTLMDDEWMVTDTLGVGETRSLGALKTEPDVDLEDLRLASTGTTGAFVLAAKASIAGDVDPSNDAAATRMRSATTLLHQGFSSEEELGATNGTAGVWSVQGGRLRAGDPITGQIPLSANATVDLTDGAIDLRSAKAATLAFKHTYDLEAAPDAGFDAGLVEISTDGGSTWRPLRPEARPLHGLPDGYPSLPLTGDGALAAQTLDEPAVAFTGRSGDIPGSDSEGWVPVEFDLARDPGLARRAILEDFSVAGFPARAPETPHLGAQGEIQFRHKDWQLDEPHAEGRHRYWWIQNLTYDAPQPRSGQQMWWSGTAGPDIRPEAEKDVQEAVENWLEFQFEVPTPPEGRDGQPLLLTWWEWRAGHQDGGTGARFTVTLDDMEFPIITLDEEDSGWRRSAIDLQGLDGQLTLRFDYDSAATPEFDDPLHANNRGWFLDDIQFVSYLFDERLRLLHSPTDMDLETLEALDPNDATDGEVGNWTTGVRSPERADIQWTLVGTGATARPGGWHVSDVDVPGQGITPAWRFADGSRQGYPYSAESRLVTPLLDLGGARGDLRLEFDHRYWFESLTKCPGGGEEGSCFRSAVDGGAIEFQVFDPATQTFGPWQPLSREPDTFPERVLFDAKTVPPGCEPFPQGPIAECGLKRHVDRLSAVPDAVDLEPTGYPAIMEAGPWIQAVTETSGAVQILTATVNHPAGPGASFATQDGLMKALFQTNSLQNYQFLRPWEPYPVSYVFSGASEGVDGWSSESWDIAPLAGQQVRFAFHASSNPSHRHEEGFPSDPAKRGWSLANVKVEGDAFDSKPVMLRLRVATDSSLGTGDWRIDDVTVSGERFDTNVALLSDEGNQIVADNGQDVVFHGRVATLGESPVGGLAVALTALRESDLKPYPVGSLDLSFPSSMAEPIEDPEAVAPNAQLAFRLQPLTMEFRPSIPFELNVALPDEDETVLLRWTLREETSKGEYGVPDLDQPGNAFSEWRAVSLHDTRVGFVPPSAGQLRSIVAQPASIAPGAALDEISLSASAENQGTTEPDVTAEWSVVRVLRKGAAEKTEDVPSSGKTESLGILPQGGSVELDHSFLPDEPGLYRVSVEITSPGESLATQSVELLLGISGTYHAVDFGSDEAGERGWIDDSEDPGDRGGGSPEAIRFRDEGDRFLWGVTDEEFADRMTYCSDSRCNFNAAQNPQGQTSPPDEPPPVYGLEGVARGPLIHLDRVPQGEAFLTIRHGHNFQADDGARIEFLPLKPGSSLDPEEREYAFTCLDPTKGPATFQLRPEHPSDHGGRAMVLPGEPMEGLPDTNGPGSGTVGEHTPELRNPLTDDGRHMPRVIGGDAESGTLTRFRLDQPAESTCEVQEGETEERVLVDYVVEPILRTGTRPGYTTEDHGSDVREGAQGWSIHSIQVSSLAVEATPASPTYPVQAGAPKTFFVTVTNAGQVEDRFRILLDESRSSLPDSRWVLPPQESFKMAPGEVRRVPVHVAVPFGDVQPGAYGARLMVQSLTDTDIRAEVDARVEVRTLRLPDLTVTLSSDAGGDPVEAGTVHPVRATVFNVGAAPSRATELTLEVVDPQGTTVVVDRASVPPLCPPGDAAAECLDPQSASFQFEWPVPTTLGEYVLRGRVDADDIVQEINEQNNVQSLQTTIEPLRQPDVAVANVTIDGLSSDGFAEEGTLITITAVIGNLGGEAAENVRAKIRFGSSTIKEERIPILEPGHERSVSVVKLVSRGDFVVSASVQHDAVDAEIDNDDVRLPLRVRGHEILLEPDIHGVSLAPGGTAEFNLEVSNDGNTVERIMLSVQDAGWGLSVLPHPVTVAPGQNSTAAVVIRAPDEATAGTHTLRILASHATGEAGSLELPVEVRQQGDVPALATNRTSQVPGPSILPVEITSLRNYQQNLTLRLASPAWDSAPALVQLPAGAARVVDLPITIPPDAPVGTTDLELVLEEGSVERARHTAVVDVLPQVAMEASWIGAGRVEEARLGARLLTFDLRITNTGNVAWRPQAELRDLPAALEAHGIPEDELLPPGDSVMFPIQLRAAPDATAVYGMVDILLRTEGAKNHLLAQALPLPDLDDAPDLHVRSVDVFPRSGLVAGRPVRAMAVVENQGSVASPESMLFASINGFLVEAVPLPEIGAQEAVTTNITVTFTKAGPFLLSLTADGENVVAEADKGNNGMSMDLQVQDGDLGDRLRSVSAPWGLAMLAIATALLARRRRT